jgi:cathepsin E
MLTVPAVFTALLLVSSAVAGPIVTIDEPIVSVPFAKQVNKGNLLGLVQKDRARAAFFKSGGNVQKRADSSVAVVNEAVTYVANVGVGTPPTNFQLIIDTGSSNTWVGAGTPFKPTASSVNTNARVAVRYGSGSFSGTEFTDTVTLGPGLTVTKQSIGVANTSAGFAGVDGIIGIGPPDLTKNTVTGVATVTTITANLFAQKQITSDLIGISFAPATADPVTNGELSFGAVDAAKFTGKLTFVPSTATAPSTEFWGIDQSIPMGGATLLSQGSGIVDTGTTLVLIATGAFDKYQSATGATVDATTGLLTVTPAQFKALQPLNFVIGGTTFALTGNAQIWPRALNTDIGGVAGKIYLITADIGAIGQGLDFINGQSFLERFYSVFDATNNRVGFAATPSTNAQTN